MRNFEQEFKNLAYWDETKNDIASLQDNHKKLETLLLALKTDSSTKQWIRELEYKIEDVQKLASILNDEKEFKEPIGKVPALENNLKEVWKVLNYITGQQSKRSSSIDEKDITEVDVNAESNRIQMPLGSIEQEAPEAEQSETYQSAEKKVDSTTQSRQIETNTPEPVTFESLDIDTQDQDVVEVKDKDLNE